MSYSGDIRTYLKWEDPYKVSNIVNNNFAHFCELYRPFIMQYLEPKNNMSVEWMPNTYFRQDVSNSSKLPLLLAQPEAVQSNLKFYITNDILLDSNDFKVLKEFMFYFLS